MCFTFYRDMFTFVPLCSYANFFIRVIQAGAQFFVEGYKYILYIYNLSVGHVIYFFKQAGSEISIYLMLEKHPADS